jgi:hypothetical protein
MKLAGLPISNYPQEIADVAAIEGRRTSLQLEPPAFRLALEQALRRYNY